MCLAILSINAHHIIYFTLIIFYQGTTSYLKNIKISTVPHYFVSRSLPLMHGGVIDSNPSQYNHDGREIDWQKLTSISPVVSKWGLAKKAYTELAKVFQNHEQYIKTPT